MNESSMCVQEVSQPTTTEGAPLAWLPAVTWPRGGWGPPLHVDPVAKELEVPQVYHMDGRYYLVFCTTPSRLLPSFRRRFPSHSFRRADYSMVGDSPLGPFRMHGTGEIAAERASVTRCASRLLRWWKQWLMIGTVYGDGTNFMCDPMPVDIDETGVHTAGTGG